MVASSRRLQRSVGITAALAMVIASLAAVGVLAAADPAAAAAPKHLFHPTEYGGNEYKASFTKLEVYHLAPAATPAKSKSKDDTGHNFLAHQAGEDMSATTKGDTQPSKDWDTSHLLNVSANGRNYFEVCARVKVAGFTAKHKAASGYFYYTKSGGATNVAKNEVHPHYNPGGSFSVQIGLGTMAPDAVQNTPETAPSATIRTITSKTVALKGSGSTRTAHVCLPLDTFVRKLLSPNNTADDSSYGIPYAGYGVFYASVIAPATDNHCTNTRGNTCARYGLKVRQRPTYQFWRYDVLQNSKSTSYSSSSWNVSTVSPLAVNVYPWELWDNGSVQVLDELYTKVASTCANTNSDWADFAKEVGAGVLESLPVIYKHEIPIEGAETEVETETIENMFDYAKTWLVASTSEGEETALERVLLSVMDEMEGIGAANMATAGFVVLAGIYFAYTSAKAESDLQKKLDAYAACVQKQAKPLVWKKGESIVNGKYVIDPLPLDVVKPLARLHRS